MEQTMKLVTAALLAGATGMAIGAKSENVAYQNDFSLRESARAIPRTDEWFEATPYSSGTSLLFSYLGDTTPGLADYYCYGQDLLGAKTMPWFYCWYASNVYGARPSQDGWFQPNFSGGSISTDVYSLYHHRFGIIKEQGNPCARFYYASNTERIGYALHSLHNRFTNGVLRIQVDLRAPKCWLVKQTPVFVFPVFDKYMDSEAWNASLQLDNCQPGAFGFRSGDNLTRAFPQFYDARKNYLISPTQLGNNYSGSGTSEKQVHWFRFVVDYDLDNARFSGRVDSLSAFLPVADYDSEPHPTFDTATTSAKSTTFSDALWIGCATNAAGKVTTDMDAFWREKGSISGIGITAGADKRIWLYGESAITNKVLVDNMRVSWKAPDASDYEVCYEDDFQTRKYRTLSYPSDCSRAYAATTGSRSRIDFFSAYPQGACDTTDKSIQGPDYEIVPLATGNHAVDSNRLQKVGLDGWRRINFPALNGNANVFVAKGAHTNGAVNTMLQMCKQGHYACVGNLIGTEVKSGKVKIVADAFLPLCPHDNGYSYRLPEEDAKRIGIGLGSKEMYTALPSAHASNLAAACGFLRVVGTGTTNDVPYAVSSGAETRGDAIPTRAQWYRMVITVDMTAKTYDASITTIGDTTISAKTTPAGALVHSVTGVPLAADVSEISSFYLWGYGYGNTLYNCEPRRGAFTNVRIVTLDADGAESRLYETDFNMRKRAVSDEPYASSYLAYQYDRDDGPDNWIRRNGAGLEWGEAAGTVRDDNGNTFASFGRVSGNGLYTEYTTPLGAVLADNEAVVSVDVRPPDYWIDADGCCLFGIGNKKLEQSEVWNSGTCRFVQFGFANVTNASSPTATVAHHVNTLPVAYDADGRRIVSDSFKFNAGSWYRLVARINFKKQTYSLSVYNQDVHHPLIGSANGSLVAKLSDISFAADVGDGASALDISVCGAGKTDGETGLDPLQVSVDNIKVRDTSGLVIIVR